jgi:hypothetical protein
MEEWSEIRRRVLVEKVSRRQVLRETGLHWKMLRKILQHSEPPLKNRFARCRPVTTSRRPSPPDAAKPPRENALSAAAPKK